MGEGDRRIKDKRQVRRRIEGRHLHTALLELGAGLDQEGAINSRRKAEY